MVKKHIKKHKSLCIGTPWIIFIYFLIIKKENPFFMVHFFSSFFFLFFIFFLFVWVVCAFISGNEKCIKYLTIYKNQILKNINCENCASLTEKKGKFIKKNEENRRRRKNLNFSMEQQKNSFPNAIAFLLMCALFQLQFMNQQHGDTNFHSKNLRRKVVFWVENRKISLIFSVQFFFLFYVWLQFVILV